MSQKPHRCRSCGGRRMRQVLSLGRTPLANRLLRPEQLRQPEPTYPLDLAVCLDCALVQLLESVPPEDLFREYVYLSSYADTMVRHAAELARDMIAERQLGADHLVVEAASNDGYLLQHYLKAGVPVLGIEPARNIAELARKRHGIDTCCEFFTPSLARKLARAGQRADVFHAHNVLAHVPDLNGFVRGIHAILKPHGVAVIEAPYVRCLVDHCEFDTIYHEHMYYFSLSTLVSCFARHRLTITHAEVVPIHGGSLRILASRSRRDLAVSPTVPGLLKEEKRAGVTGWKYYADFARRVESLAASLRRRLRQLKRSNHRLAAYGASAKGSTLLNFCGIGNEFLDFVVDRSQLKQGKYTPGTHLPIVPTEELLERQPDGVLLLTWNFAEEIMAQQAEYRKRGGKFIIPVPRVKVA